MGPTSPVILTYANYAGAIKAFKALVAALAAAGHDCEVVAVPSVAAPNGATWEKLSSVQPKAAGANPIRFALTRRLPLAELRGGSTSELTRLHRQRLVYREFGALVRRTIEAWKPDRVIVGHGAFHLRSALALARKKLALSVATTVRSRSVLVARRPGGRGRRSASTVVHFE